MIYTIDNKIRLFFDDIKIEIKHPENIKRLINQKIIVSEARLTPNKDIIKPVNAKFAVIINA